MKLICKVYSISQDIIVNDVYIVETDNLPIKNSDPDLKYYGVNTIDNTGGYDMRGYDKSITEEMIESAHPSYPDLLEYRITITAVRKSNEDLYLVVDSLEYSANEQLAPNKTYGHKRQRQNRILNKKAGGTNPTTEEDEFLEAMDEIANAIDDNADNADSMKDYIEANPTLIPDFDVSWTISI